MHNSIDKEVSQQKKLITDGFLEQAKKQPNTFAIISNGKCITYQELLSRSLLLSEQLVSLGAKPNKLVAIVMEKG